MGTFVGVSRIGELEDGTMKAITVEGREILLARVGGKYYAADDRCPHKGGRLSQGKLEGTIVTCPLHSSQFDLGNGQVVRWLKGAGLISTVSKVLRAPRPINTYEVKLEQDMILVKI